LIHASIEAIPPVKRAATIAVILSLLGTAAAQSARKAPIQSSSGQFIVLTAPPGALPSRFAASVVSPDFIVLQPELLAVSCERIKQRLWAMLGVDMRWGGKVYLELHPAASGDEWVDAVATPSPSGWEYHVALPDALSRDRFLRAIVQVLLLDYAHRNRETHAVEVPTWLAEGLSRELRGSGEVELFLSPPNWSVHGLSLNAQIMNARWSNPLERAQKELRARPPMTFEQLSWPADETLAGDAGEAYRCSAQFFVDSLLRLPGGATCLRTMIDELPRYYNWQLAFLQAFQSHFHNLLAVEKWWALQIVQFTGRDLTQTWTPEESWKKLDQILRSPVDVRTEKGQLPLSAEVSLQTILREWDRPRQMEALRRELRELEFLRFRVAQDLVLLVDDYRASIQNCLQHQSQIDFNFFTRKRVAPAADPAVQEAIRQLDILDARREALQPQVPAAVTEAAQGTVQ
jgi:hypothetical protein